MHASIRYVVSTQSRYAKQFCAHFSSMHMNIRGHDTAYAHTHTHAQIKKIAEKKAKIQASTKSRMTKAQTELKKYQSAEQKAQQKLQTATAAKVWGGAFLPCIRPVGWDKRSPVLYLQDSIVYSKAGRISCHHRCWGNSYNPCSRI